MHPGTWLLHVTAEVNAVEGPTASRSIRRGQLVVPSLLGASSVTYEIPLGAKGEGCRVSYAALFRSQGFPDVIAGG